MDRKELTEVLAAVEAGALSAEEAAARLARAPFEDLGYAKPDLARGMRQGVGEVVYGEGKTASQIEGICRALAEGGQPRVLVTRVDEAKAASLAAALPAFAYRPEARLGIVGGLPQRSGAGRIVVAAAGTSDVPVAEEAAVTAEFLGNDVVRCYDVGVAGIHRLFACADELAQARVVVAVAGMEGALPSVVAGLVACPVVAVPTQRGLRGVVRRGHGASGHAELVRERRVGGQHRQRLRRRLPGEPDQPSGHLLEPIATRTRGSERRGRHPSPVGTAPCSACGDAMPEATGKTSRPAAPFERAAGRHGTERERKRTEWDGCCTWNAPRASAGT